MSNAYTFEVTSDPPNTLRAKLAAATRHGHPQSERDNLKRDLNEAVLSQEIKRVVDSAPGLTDVQAARLAALLRPSFSDRDSAPPDSVQGDLVHELGDGVE